jgi:hypothetical protein
VGGKTSTSTSQVQIPPEVLARYNSVNATAQNVAQTPFQQYSTDPSAFVAPLTPTQQSGITNTNAAAGMAQPYYGAATGFALAGSQPVNPGALDTSTYMNPYLQTVLGSTAAQINQNNQQAMSGATGSAMNQGYFGGDRSGIASAVLQGQQNLAAGQVYSGIASDAYQQALAAAQQQQGVQLGAAQANRAATQQTGETLANLGAGAQQAALTGAQAQLGAGQVQQQTTQAGDTALYNQFLQQQSYPFQTAQFLANIAEGTGALSGSTTATTQPGGLFSDERLKEDMEPIGKGFDGANIYRFRYRGDPTTRIGMSAQEVERKHPEAVSEHGGFKAVDYGAATDDAAQRGGFALAANDNHDDEPRQARQAGGGMSGWGMYPSGANPMVIQQLLESQAQMYAPYSGAGGPGLYGGSASGMPHGGSSYVPAASLPVGQLQVARPVAAPQPSGLGADIHEAASLADDAEGLSKDYHFAHEGFDKLRGFLGGDSGGGGNMTGPPNANGGRVARQGGGGLGDWLTAAVSGSPSAAAAANRRLVAHTQAVRAAQAQQRAAAAAAAAHPQPPGPSGFPQSTAGPPAGGLTFGGGNPNAGRWGGMGQAANWAGNADWIGTPDQVARSRAWNAAHGAPAPAPTPAPAPGGPGGQAPSLLARTAALTGDPGLTAAAIHHHTQQAQAHASVAQQLASQASGREAPDLTLNTGREQPLADTQPINVGDVSNLQTGFAPANLHPYNPNIFQRFGNWIGDEASGVGRWLTEPSQSRAVGEDVAAANRREAPTQQLPANQLASQASGREPDPSDLLQTPPIQSEAFQPRDPTVDALAPPVTLATGGFARAHRQMGGDLSNPQNDNPYQPQGAGLNIPTAETQHPKLATAAPPGQGPSGLSQALGAGSDIASIGTAAAKFLPMLLALRRGGRAGYADGGDPTAPDPTDGPPMTPDVAQIEEKYAPQTVTPRMLALGASKREAPLVSTQAPTVPAPDPTDDPTAAPPIHAPGFGGANADSAAPGPAGGPPSGGGGFFSGIEHALGGFGKAALGMAGYQGDGHWDKDRLIPFVTGLADMLAAPTKYPLVALTQGLKGGAQSYMQQQQAEQQLNLTGAEAQRQQYEAEPEAIRGYTGTAPGFAMTPDGRAIDRSRSFQSGDGKWHHYVTADEMLGGAGGGAPPAPGLATPQTQQGGVGGAGAPAAQGAADQGLSRGPIHVDYKSGTQSWAPSSVSDQQFSGLMQGRGDVSGNGQMRNRVQIGLLGLGGAAQAAEKDYETNQAGQSNYQTSSRQLQQLALAVNQMPTGGLGAMGEGYDERQTMLKLAQTANRIIMGGDDPGLNAQTSQGDLIRKIRGLASTQLTQQAGLHAQGVQQMLNGILPGAESANVDTANQMISSMMVANQQLIDKPAFEQAYNAKYGTMLGADQAFTQETGSLYGEDQATLMKMMKRGAAPGGDSIAEYMMKHPDQRRAIEFGARKGNQFNPGVGIGSGRYWTERLT